MTKKILIIAMNKHWTGIGRLPSGLDRAGFIIYALCPKGSYLSLTKYLTKKILFPTFTYSRSKIVYLYVTYALLKLNPDMVIPGDEETILILHNLNSFFLKIPYFKKFAVLIRTSFPAKEFDKMIFSKSEFIENCLKWNVQVPKNLKVKTFLEAKQTAKEIGYPVVLKLDVGYGGSGVFICQNEEDLEIQFSKKNNYSLFIHLKFLIKKLFFVSINSKENKDLEISVQQYIKGLAGHVSFCALDGKLLGANQMLSIRTYPGDTGPSSVSQGINNDLLFEFVKTVASKILYNGFGSLDFMFDKLTNKIYVIELNSRPTPTCHLSSEVVAYDLCTLLYKGLNKEKIEENNFKPFIIAMYPNEMKRDPESAFLKEAYHDIPHDDVLLMKALVL